MKRILQKMTEMGLIMAVPGTRGGGFAYQKPAEITSTSESGQLF